MNDDSHQWWQADLMTEQKWRREERAQFKAWRRREHARTVYALGFLGLVAGLVWRAHGNIVSALSGIMESVVHLLLRGT